MLLCSCCFWRIPLWRFPLAITSLISGLWSLSGILGPHREIASSTGEIPIMMRKPVWCICMDDYYVLYLLLLGVFCTCKCWADGDNWGYGCCANCGDKVIKLIEKLEPSCIICYAKVALDNEGICAECGSKEEVIATLVLEETIQAKEDEEHAGFEDDDFLCTGYTDSSDEE